jgi:hypothetical protein
MIPLMSREAKTMSLSQEKKFNCVVPTVELLSKKDTLASIIESHEWQVDKTEALGDDQILVKAHCAICELNRIFIMSNIIDSSKRASQIREAEKWR